MLRTLDKIRSTPSPEFRSPRPKPTEELKPKPTEELKPKPTEELKPKPGEMGNSSNACLTLFQTLCEPQAL